MTAPVTVVIVGAGPAGLLVGNTLLDNGIDCLILERQSRAHIEQRARAGLIEHRAVESLDELGLADRLLTDGAEHTACEFRFEGSRLVADYGALTGRRHVVYPQQELVRDLVAIYLKKGGELRFETEVGAITDLDGSPTVQLGDGSITGGVVVGADGFLGASRRAIPAGAAAVYDYRHPYGWLSILAQAPPSTRDIIYAMHPDGFAGHMLRTPSVSRFYLQCPAEDSVASWPDERIWRELRTRLGTTDGWHLNEGPIIEKSVLDMRSVVTEPLQFGNLYLAGDAAHILTPAGAKGMNLALGDARELALGLVARLRYGDESRLSAYSRTRLEVIWRVQEFSSWLLNLLHRSGDTAQPGPFADRLRAATIAQITDGSARAQAFAEAYAG